MKRSYFKNSFVFIVNQNGTILFNTQISIVSAYEITETEYTNITESEWLQINDKNTENLTISVNKGKNIIVRRFIDFNIPDVNQFFGTWKFFKKDLLHSDIFNSNGRIQSRDKSSYLYCR